MSEFTHVGFSVIHIRCIVHRLSINIDDNVAYEVSDFGEFVLYKSHSLCQRALQFLCCAGAPWGTQGVLASLKPGLKNQNSKGRGKKGVQC